MHIIIHIWSLTNYGGVITSPNQQSSRVGLVSVIGSISLYGYNNRLPRAMKMMLGNDAAVISFLTHIRQFYCGLVHLVEYAIKSMQGVGSIFGLTLDHRLRR